ncbi:MAG TPA: DUF4112 domain-containing protein [Gemmatimonadaceae bacterium]|nr:DUF4112 domain-containing protein [Gemmatimonadaceae bacterium]
MLRDTDSHEIPPDLLLSRRGPNFRGLARLLDTAIQIPGTRIRFGIDSLIGLIPGVGDVATAAISGYIILSAARVGASPAIIARMILNLGADTLVGAIPVLGDVFDVAFKANVRNVNLLERHLGEPITARKPKRGMIPLAIGAVVVLIAAAILLAMGVAKLLNALIQ